MSWKAGYFGSGSAWKGTGRYHMRIRNNVLSLPCQIILIGCSSGGIILAALLFTPIGFINAHPDPVLWVNADQDPRALWPKFVQFWNTKNFIFRIKNCNIFIHRPPSSMSDVQVTGEGALALESSKDSIQHFKNTSTLVHLFLSFWELFLSTWTQNWIHPTESNADPCGSGSTTMFSSEIKWPPVLCFVDIMTLAV